MTGDQATSPGERLDQSWVLRWLDDVGLPQYKDAFSEARIDGRVLNCITYDDLAFLRFNNLLHVTSLKRGIQVIYCFLNKFYFFFAIILLSIKVFHLYLILKFFSNTSTGA